jgi:hypothetical protein
VTNDGFLKEFRLVGGPCHGKIVPNDGPTPMYVNERVRFTVTIKTWSRPAVTALYRMNADGTGTWLEGK